jgi:hypothetical protein
MGVNNDDGLIFIFNADSGAINSVKDFFHKMVKPSTYECNLCAVTFGNFGMKKDWAQYVKNLENDINTEFLHRDEFEDYYPQIKDAKYPSAYYKKGNKLELFISQEEMNNVKSVEELKEMVDNRLKNRT